MAYDFTTNLTIQNAARLELADVSPQRAIRKDPSSATEVHVELELRAGTAGTTPRALFGSYILVVRNGVSDVIRVRTGPEWLAGSPISERLIVVRNAISTPTGMTTFLNAVGAGNTNAKLNAGLNELKALGVIDQTTLAGTA